MKQSITYYITLFIIKLKGIKKEFSKDPIDFKKIRKEDIHHPKGAFFKQKNIYTFKISDTLITEVNQNKSSTGLLIFIHGGAFISGPAKHHWDTIQQIAKHTNHTIWMCDYPKAPENTISTISQNIDLMYTAALEKHQAKYITLIGDSVGGTLVTALTQRLIQKKQGLPTKIILISPVMDATMSHPEIDKIDPIDPMLSKTGVLSAKKMCAKDQDLKNPMISPIQGSFNKFPETIIFIAENDITYPDQLLTIQKLKESAIDIEVIKGENMPHIWPLLPVMREAKIALRRIIDRVKT
ncbi:alpha/beta hydrolase [Aquimarina sp. 2201CG5-10]|uniref:alpha/beta hydrolase n=1 Tax=Aquimarina callyspongiae TaxID=3098150 RepID=UPI002AB5A261|nr:alpha/beta hydrolase [Aquimarina sp. 2201CG5-10]MDY8134456.1 alpha/beta hydrolase [Aquimarina sp. 2201CG5-10]